MSTIEIKVTMPAQNTNTLTAEAFVITWKQITRERLNTAALKATRLEIAERFTKTTTSWRFELINDNVELLIWHEEGQIHRN